jgi:hypothetical protein
MTKLDVLRARRASWVAAKIWWLLPVKAKVIADLDALIAQEEGKP